VYTLKNTLTGTRFVKEIASGNPSVRVYQFRHQTQDKDVYAVWCSTSSQTRVEHFPLVLGNSAKNVSLVRLVSGETAGQSAPLALVDGKVSVSVTERPVFVVVKGKD
jgi:hypothetical protein